jgi:hypothetical protein
MLGLVSLIFERSRLRCSCRNLPCLSQCSSRSLLFFAVIPQCSLSSRLCNIFSTLIPVNGITDSTLTPHRFTSFSVYDVTSSRFGYQHCCNLAMQLVAYGRARFPLASTATVRGFNLEPPLFVATADLTINPMSKHASSQPGACVREASFAESSYATCQ